MAANRVLKLTNAGEAQFYEPSAGGASYIAVKSPALAATWTLTLPVDDGAASTLLMSDGAGNTSWVASLPALSVTTLTVTDLIANDEIRITEPGGPSYCSFVSPALAATLAYTLPAAFPAVTGFLQSDNVGTLSWAASAATLQTAYTSGEDIVMIADTMDWSQANDNGMLVLTKTGAGAGDVLTIHNDGTGTALAIVQDGIGYALDIDQDFAESAVRISQSVDDMALEVLKTGGGVGNAVYIENDGTGAALAIVQDGQGYGIDVDQDEAESAVRISQSAEDIGLEIIKTNVGAGTALSVHNDGTGVGLAIDQDGHAYALDIDQSTDHSALRITQSGDYHGIEILKTGAAGGNGIFIDNDGTGGGIRVNQDGIGYGIYIDQDAAESALLIEQSANDVVVELSKDGAGAGAIIDITNGGTGLDIDGNASNWYVRKGGGAILRGLVFPHSHETIGVISDEITITTDQCYILLTSGTTAADDLDTITNADGATDGQILILELDAASPNVQVKHGVGNISLSTGNDFTLDAPADKLVLIYSANDGQWNEICRCNNP